MSTLSISIKRQLNEETADRLFDVISGFYSLSDHGYPITEAKRDAAIIACEVLESKHGITTMAEERKAINEIYGGVR